MDSNSVDLEVSNLYYKDNQDDWRRPQSEALRRHRFYSKHEHRSEFALIDVSSSTPHFGWFNPHYCVAMRKLPA